MALRLLMLLLMLGALPAAAAPATDVTAAPGTGARPAATLTTDDSLWTVVDSVPIGAAGGFWRGLKMDPDGNTFWIMNGQLTQGYQVQRRSRTTGAIIDSFYAHTAASHNGCGVVRFGDSICVAEFYTSPSSFDIYDTLGNYGRSFNSPTEGVRGVDWDGSKFWVSTAGGGIFTMTRGGTLLKTLATTGITSSYDFCLDPAYPNRLWVTDRNVPIDVYCEFDTTANTCDVLASFTPPGGAATCSGISYYRSGDSAYLYTTCNTANQVWKVLIHQLPGAVGEDSLYFKNYYAPSALYGAPKSSVPNPSPQDCRPPFSFMDQQSRVCMDPDGIYIYEVSDGTTLRRHATADGSYTDFTLAHYANTAVKTDGSFLYVPANDTVYKYDMTGNFVNATAIDVSPAPYDFSVARDTVWCNISVSTQLGYACSRFTGGSISEDASWDLGPGSGDPAFVTWDGTYFYVAFSGLASNTFKVFDANRVQVDSGTVAIDPRGLMCRWSPATGVAQPVEQVYAAVPLAVSPNPLRGSCRVSYSLPAAGRVGLKLFDAAGRLAADLGSRYTAAGNHTVCVDASALRAGVYLLSLETPAGKAVRKLVLE